MALKLNSLSGVLVLTVASAVLTPAKIAQAEPFQYHPVADEFNNRFFQSSGDYFLNNSFQGQLGDFLGVGSPSGRNAFPEKEQDRDASRIHGYYREMMQRQVSSDPLLRVPDAVNPFDTSVMAQPLVTSASGTSLPFQQQFNVPGGASSQPFGVPGGDPSAQPFGTPGGPSAQPFGTPGPVRGLYNLDGRSR